MASYNEFKPEATPILFYSPKPHVDTRPGGRRFLIFPVYAYKVLAPRPTERRLNLFQKAVLGFCRLGITEPDKISSHLLLDREIVKFVLSELRRANYLNPDNHLTTLGEKILSSELDRLPDEIVPAYIFQDPWTGKLWPRVAQKLEFVEVDFENDRRYPVLILGTKGSPKRISPFVKRADMDVMPRTPTPSEILHASRRHERDNRIGMALAEEEEDLSADDDVFINSPIDSINLREISIISEEPELYFMTTTVYIPNYDLHKVEWYICDPFGLGASPWLRRWMDQQLLKDANLKLFVEKFINDCLGDTLNIKNSAEDQLTLEMIASETIIQRLGEGIGNNPIFVLIKSMERTYQETLLYPGEPPKDKLEDVMIKAGKTIEGLFRYLHGLYYQKDAWKIYNFPDRQNRYSVLNEISKSLGFSIPLPYSFSGISPLDIHRSIETGGGTLGERTVAALLIAHYEPNHPIRNVAITMPDIFTNIGTLMKLRGLSAHDTDLDLSSELVSSQREFIYQMISNILIHSIETIGGTHD